MQARHDEDSDIVWRKRDTAGRVAPGEERWPRKRQWGVGRNKGSIYRSGQNLKSKRKGREREGGKEGMLLKEQQKEWCPSRKR